MKIQVLGSGCATCKSLFELTQKAAKEMGINDTVEYITDVTKIIEMGVMTSPLIAIDGKPALIGSTSDIERIKDILKTNSSETTSDENCCDGKCCENGEENENCTGDCCSVTPVAKTCTCGGNC